MAFGDAFKNAWNGASEAVQEAVSVLATEGQELASDIADSAVAAARWAADTSADVADWAGRRLDDASAWAEQKLDDARAWTDQKVDDAMTWGAAKATALGERVRDASHQVQEWFSDAVAGGTKLACQAALASEGYAYERIAGGLATFGDVKGWVTDEDLDVDFTDENFVQWTGGITIEESQMLYQLETGETISRETIETLFTDPEKSKKILLENENIHKIYRDILNSNVPMNAQAAVDDPNWIELSKGKSAFHGSYTRGNRKFVSADGYREVVYTPEGTIDGRNALKGTFNFFSPTAYPDSHIAADVAPYAEHGN